MKKLIGILGVATFSMMLFANTSNMVDKGNLDFTSLTTLSQAQAEFDPIGSCNSWCTSGTQCVLVTNAGFNIYCNGWDQP